MKKQDMKDFIQGFDEEYYDDFEQKNIEYKIKNRNNILRWASLFLVLIIIVLIIFAKKIIIDLSSFDFSDFLALVVSLWAMYISVLFYQSSNKTSQNFYDNFYKFITDVSEQIGRLDVGVNKEFEYLKTNFTSQLNGGNNNEMNKLQKQIKEQELKAELKQEELDKLLQSILESNKDSDKLEKQIKDLMKEVRDTEYRTINTSNKIHDKILLQKIQEIILILVNTNKTDKLEHTLAHYSQKSARELLSLIIKFTSFKDFDLLYNSGILTKDKGSFTLKGFDLFRREYFNIRNRIVHSINRQNMYID